MGQGMGDMARRDLARVAKAKQKVVQAQAELRASIIAAVESGETYRAVAAQAGISHQRVAQIVRGQ